MKLPISLLFILILVNCHWDEEEPFLSAAREMIFTASMTDYAILFRNSVYKGSVTYAQILEWTAGAIDFDPHGFKDEFRLLVRKTKNMVEIVFPCPLN